MATIIEAAKWMREGKRVRNPRCDADSYFYADRGSSWIHYQSAPLQRIMPDAIEVNDLLATDWEVVPSDGTEPRR